VVVKAANDTDLETTVHWHGLQLDNRFDGTHYNQDPIEPGDTFGYGISCPDPGVYWYHPHIRQDYGQEGRVQREVTPGRSSGRHRR
jgi:FtsP/CotA-like multicopper oxidase with cupredoxin domain